MAGALNPYNYIVTLRGLSETRVDAIVEEYEYFADVEHDNPDLLITSERYYGKLEGRYSVSKLYKCFYWYLYSKANQGNLKSAWSSI